MSKGLKGLRVLVLGGAGFIGQHLCRALLESGVFVRCFDLGKPPSGSIALGLENEAEWLTGSIDDSARIVEALDGIDFVFHLVSTTIPETSNRDLPGDLTSNVLPTLAILEAIRRSPVKKIIFISSGGTVYGIPRVLPIPESHPTNPICGYGVHKLAIEKYLYYYHHAFGLDYRVLRLGNPYGVVQISDRPQGAIGKFVYKALREEHIEVWGDGSVVRDYVYIEDAIEAFILAMRHDGNTRLFNVGSGTGHSLLQILGVIADTAGVEIDVEFKPARQVDVPANVLDIGLIRSELGWVPKTDLAAGIRLMVDAGSGMLGLAHAGRKALAGRPS